MSRFPTGYFADDTLALTFAQRPVPAAVVEITPMLGGLLGSEGGWMLRVRVQNSAGHLLFWAKESAARACWQKAGCRGFRCFPRAGRCTRPR